jgi:hypothetical protein
MKKILNIFLVLALIMGSLPMNAAAEPDFLTGVYSLEKTVTGIAVNTNPAKLDYTEGESLSLEGLTVILSYSDSTSDQVGYEDFPYMGISANPAHGTILTAAYNGLQVELTCGGYTACTDALTVTAAPVNSASLSPAVFTFDKNPADQADVSTTITWNDAHSVMSVKNTGTPVGEEAYAVSATGSSLTAVLTISREYLASQPEGALALTVEFDRGTAAELTIDIRDTGAVTWPVWPDGSYVSTPDRTQTSITLSWTPAQDDVGVTGYRLLVYQGIYQEGDTPVCTVECTDTTYAFTGLSPGTQYSFWLQAMDGDGEFSAILPHVVSTYPESAAADLWLTAPRYNLYGSLYMGDTAVIELISTETGWQPEVTVYYREWNSSRTAVEDKSRNITLDEISPGSKRYTGGFLLSEGICEITVLEGELSPGVPVAVPTGRKVAGRLRAEVVPPSGLSVDEIFGFNNLLAGNYILVRGSDGIGSYISPVSTVLAPNVFVTGGLEAADAGHYELTHYNAQSFVLRRENITVPVRNGLETVFQYTVDKYYNLRVKVVDDLTGVPVRDVAVTSSVLTFVDGSKGSAYGVTGDDGYAGSSRFAENLLLDGSGILLSTSAGTDSNSIDDFYLHETVSFPAPATIGDNEIELRLKRAGMVTLQGRVTGSDGNPLKNIFVSMPQKFGNSPVINVSSRTDDNGRYSMQIAKLPGEVSFSAGGTVIKKQINPTAAVNILDAVMPALATPVVEVFFEEVDDKGNVKKVEILFGLTVTNRTNGKSGLKVSGSLENLFSIQGNPGDVIEAVFNIDDSTSYGYGRTSATAVLSSGNYVGIRLELKKYGTVHVRFTDSSGDEKPDVFRGMTIYRAGGDPARDECVAWAISPDEYLSCSLPAGDYRAVFSWDMVAGRTLSDWENAQNRLITDSFRVENGKTADLGEKRLSYQVESNYFRNNAGNSFSAGSSAAVPGRTITLNAAYDYNAAKSIDPGKLDLVVQIPQGTELVSGSVLNKVTRGSIGSASPVTGSSEISLDLKDGVASGVAGLLTFKVTVSNPQVYERITSKALVRFNVGGAPRTEIIGAVSVPVKRFTMNALSQVIKPDVDKPVRLNGIAPANSTVELYDGNIKIGEAQASANGDWEASVSLPDRGTPIYHSITAKTEDGSSELTCSSPVLVGSDRINVEKFLVGVGWEDYIWTKFLPEKGIFLPSEQGVSEYVFHPCLYWHYWMYIGTQYNCVVFTDNNKATNVKINGRDAERFQYTEDYSGLDSNFYQASTSVRYTGPVVVQYDEQKSNEEILKYDHGQPPESLVNADAEFVDGTAGDIKLEYGADGILEAFHMPEIKLTVEGEPITMSMSLESVDFNPAAAKNRAELADGLYGYDFSWEETSGGECVLSAYVDKRLLEQTQTEASSHRVSSFAVSPGLEFAKVMVKTAGDVDKVTGAYGDLSKVAKTAELRDLLEKARPNLDPNLADYYESQLQRMGKEYMVGKALGFVTDGLENTGKLVPLAGEVVIGVASYISGKLLGDMFDNEFDSDYARLKSHLSNAPGAASQSSFDSMPFYNYNNGNDYSGNSIYDYGVLEELIQLNRTSHGPESYRVDSIDYGSYWRNTVTVAIQHYIDLIDPSGFVYEAVEDNRIEGVTATVMYLPKSAAPDAAAAKASSGWQVWNAAMFNQENPQTTNLEGRYGWDVPEGWWMVQYVKDGYGTTYSDALPVPPPQLEVNIPMVRLAKPAVEKTVWGSGGRYVDVYFSKYMDMRTFGAANAVSLTDSNGGSVSGSAISAIPAKTGVNGLSLTKAVRFVPGTPLTEGGEYTLTVNAGVTDYAGFPMTGDYTELGTVPPAALIGSLTAADITAAPKQDITQAVLQTLTFTAVDPAMQNLLDKRLIFSSSDDSVIRIREDGRIISVSEGNARITATSMDDPSKTAGFNVAVAYTPAPVKIRHMAVLDGNGKVLTDLSLNRGDTYILSPVITPANAANKRVSYTSDNPSVAAVDSFGILQALSEGIATITAVTEDQNIRQKIFVTVKSAPTTYIVSFNANGGSVTPAAIQTGTDGKLPSLPVPVRSGSYSFDGWYTAANAGTVITASTVFAADTTVYAHWTYTGGGSNPPSDGGGHIPSTPDTTTGKKPDRPTIASMNLTATVDKNGNATVTIIRGRVKALIDAAKKDAKSKDKTADGIGVAFNIRLGADKKSISVKLDEQALELLEKEGVERFDVNTPTVNFSFDKTAIKKIRSQAAGVVILSVKPVTKLSGAAKTLIGKRPVYDLTLSYQKNGKTKYITSLGEGIVTLGIACKEVSGEKTGNLFGVYVGKDGKPQLLDRSSYNNGRVIFGRSSLSTYGIGYKVPAPAFTDTVNHWAKDSIDFAASRGLISGTGARTFSPDTNITCADFLMALGKLSGADMSGYKTSDSTDAKSTGSAAPYIEWASRNGIVQGIGSNRFDPDSQISREQAAVIMVNYANAAGYKLPVSRQAITFADGTKISSWAKEAVKAIQQAGIIVGKDNNLFDPAGNVTRAEASTILRRFVELVIEENTARGWGRNDSGQWQYIDVSGKAVTGWLTVENEKYYFTAGGLRVSAKWLELDGKWYYFYADGSLARSTKIDGYEIDENGVRKAK